jgi:serine kinase of HPr protein (carbohydrate metabolism regulator)
MIERRFNIHATTIVIGTTGLLFVGESGSGKSTTAFACLACARQQGLFAALVADDRTLISQFGAHILAEQPASISGLIELRGSGIATVTHIAASLVQYAVRPVKRADLQRLPPEDEIFVLPGGGSLPLLRLDAGAPVPLDILAAFIPELRAREASQ